jgi:pilus assembly protein Flp/PilA
MIGSDQEITRGRLPFRVTGPFSFSGANEELGRQGLNRGCAMRSWLQTFLRDEEGPTAVEYAVMLAFIIIVCIAAITVLGQRTNDVFQKTANSLPS